MKKVVAKMLKDAYCSSCNTYFNPYGEIHRCSNDTMFTVYLTQEELDWIETLANSELIAQKKIENVAITGFNSNACLALESIIEKMRKS